MYLKHVKLFLNNVLKSIYPESCTQYKYFMQYHAVYAIKFYLWKASGERIECTSLELSSIKGRDWL